MAEASIEWTDTTWNPASRQASTRREVTERAEASEGTDQFPYRVMNEDLKGPREITRYGNERKVAEGDGRSHGPNRADTGDNGRYIAGNETDRFWSKVDMAGEGCWLWTAARTADGYGRFRVGRSGHHRHVRAHRWAYEHLVGRIPAGHELDHLCRQRACVRPDHLEAVTPTENKRRARTWAGRREEPPMANRQHLHRDDYPCALAILAHLFAHRSDGPANGYEATEHGASVDWEALEHGRLSSTERAAVVAARGIAMAERQGGWAPGLHTVLVDALTPLRTP